MSRRGTPHSYSPTRQLGVKMKVKRNAKTEVAPTDVQLPEDPQDGVASLIRYLFRAPGIATSIALIILLSMASSPLFFPGSTTDALAMGAATLAIPAVGAALATTPMARLAGRTFALRRGGLLALLCLLATVALAAPFRVAEVAGTEASVLTGVAAGIGMTCGLRVLTLLALVDSRLPRAAPAAAVQPLLAVLGLWAVGGEAFIAEAVGAAIICGVGGWAIAWAIDAPLRREFGVSSLDFIRGFLGLVTYGERDIDHFFEPVAVVADLPLGAFAARRPGGKVRAMMVVPYLHPGPFGTVGGGDLPVRLQHALAAPTLVLHGTCTHDFNPVSSRECDRLALKVKGMLRGLDWGGATRSVRVQVGDVKVLGQRFGATALLVGTLAPECTEDVELGVGLAAMEAARGAGLPNIVLADAHNTTTPTPNLVLRGNPESYDYIEACRRAARELAKLRPQKAKLGVATRRPYLNPAQGVGGLGLTVMVVEAGRQRTAYVGIDANNIVGGLRERILAALPDMDHAEVVTSDSHEGNTLTKTNFVGERLDAEVLIRDVRALCDAAVTSLEPVEWGGAVSLARGLRVVGAQRSSKLAGIVAAMKHLLWGLILAVGLACAAVSAVLFALL